MVDPSDGKRDRWLGLARNGEVQLYDFDLGVVTTLGAIEQDDPKKGPIGYFIPEVPNVCPPDGLPGIPVVFAYPEDVLKDFKEPIITVRRDDLSPAMDRWTFSGTQYNGPGVGAIPSTVTRGSQTKLGWDRTEGRRQAHPYDITYTISIKARFRGAKGNRSSANALFQHVMQTYPAYTMVKVYDSLGDFRTYEAFNEGITSLDSIGEVQERELGFAITLRVEAELDLVPAYTTKTARTLTKRLKQM